MKVNTEGLEELHGVVKPTTVQIREEACKKLREYNPGREFTYHKTDRGIYTDGGKWVGTVTTIRISRNQHKIGRYTFIDNPI